MANALLMRHKSTPQTEDADLSLRVRMASLAARCVLGEPVPAQVIPRSMISSALCQASESLGKIRRSMNE
jgi:hypothetical protein